MGFLDDIFSAPRTTIGEVDGSPIVLDAAVRQVHSVEGAVSDHPVESGVDIVDHYRVLPRAVEIEGAISNSPLEALIPGATLVKSAIGLIQGDEEPALNAWAELNRFYDEAVVVEIVTSLQTYPNMVLTSLQVTRDASRSNGLFFTATAREGLFVDTVEGAAVAIPSTTQGQATKSAGKATNTTANASEDAGSSALLKSFQSFGLML
jgi:hypothetical protein